jgi:hypothetical protein
MSRAKPLMALVLAATAVFCAPADARGRVWGGVSIGIGLPFYYHPYPAYAVAPPQVAYTEPAPVPAAPEPIIYPRDGQSPAQTEADRQACNRWATSQPKAMADASVFHRATLACMEGRGYTVR